MDPKCKPAEAVAFVRTIRSVQVKVTGPRARIAMHTRLTSRATCWLLLLNKLYLCVSLLALVSTGRLVLIRINFPSVLELHYFLQDREHGPCPSESLTYA